jgi:hypothetical protein
MLHSAGTKLDRREKCDDPVSESDGRRLASIIKASSFLEVSSRLKDTVDQLFMLSVFMAKEKREERKGR